MSGCPAAEVVMATPMGVILVPLVSVSGMSPLPPLERVRERPDGHPPGPDLRDHLRLELSTAR
ncbi:hypothetical protein HEK616_60660 [Streptomyces nigrescens]|uniref:Uncharacterized protein n=1 Tax=Streptomyces nigrescens TaxID=1920 RepID=A0ABN6R2C4_STRNI|nr:hypothetical protein HEK616_60660 [Streptomyces nigrescens]